MELAIVSSDERYKCLCVNGLGALAVLDGYLMGAAPDAH